MSCSLRMEKCNNIIETVVECSEEVAIDMRKQSAVLSENLCLV